MLCSLKSIFNHELIINQSSFIHAFLYHHIYHIIQPFPLMSSQWIYGVSYHVSCISNPLGGFRFVMTGYPQFSSTWDWHFPWNPAPEDPTCSLKLSAMGEIAWLFGRVRSAIMSCTCARLVGAMYLSMYMICLWYVYRWVCMWHYTYRYLCIYASMHHYASCIYVSVYLCIYVSMYLCIIMYLCACICKYVKM